MNNEYIKYESTILKSYLDLGFTPRDNQLSIINRVLVDFLDKGISNVILCAGTGSGKSVMAMVIAKSLAKLRETMIPIDKKGNPHIANIIMNTNVLVDQYINSFNKLPESDFYYRIGAVNYPCPELETQLASLENTKVTADFCNHETKENGHKCPISHICKYMQARIKARKTAILVSNYSYYMSRYMHSTESKTHLINIFDEAHTMNDVFCGFAEFSLTDKLVEKFIYSIHKIMENFDLSVDEESKFRDLLEELTALKISLSLVEIEDEFDFKGVKPYEKETHMNTIREKNFKKFNEALGLINPILINLVDICKNIFKREYPDEKIHFPWGENTSTNKEIWYNQQKESNKSFTRRKMQELEESLANQYNNLKIAISRSTKLIQQIELIRGDNEILFEQIATDKENGLKVSPIFIKKYWENLNHAKFNLFMSATVTKEYMENTISLEGKTDYIFVPSTFPKENKTIVSYKPQYLNYLSMQKPETINQIKTSCSEIVNMYSQVNGLILTTTFDLTRKIADHIRKTTSIAVFEHQQGEKVADVIKKFKESKKPSVMISPSMWEGISFDDDLSRYQIITKTPYASLASKRNKFVQIRMPEIYQQQTLLTLIQGFGRSVRNAEDFCFTFCLDATTFNELNKPYNVWKNDFKYQAI